MDHSILKDNITQIIALEDEDLALLMGRATYREFKKGEAILNEGEVCRLFYLVEKGYLRTYYNKEGVAINLNFSFENDFTTNLKSYQSRQPSNLVIEAGEDAGIWILNLSGVVSTEYPEPARFIRRLALRILLKSEEHSNMFKINTPTERYSYIEANNPELLQRVPLSQLASYIGVARETLSRIRGKNAG